MGDTHKNGFAQKHPNQASGFEQNAPPTSSATDFEKASKSKGRAFETAKALVTGPARAIKNAVTGTIDAAQPRDAGERAYYDQTKGYTLNPLAPIANVISHTVRDIGEGTL